MQLPLEQFYTNLFTLCSCSWSMSWSEVTFLKSWVDKLQSSFLHHRGRYIVNFDTFYANVTRENYIIWAKYSFKMRSCSTLNITKHTTSVKKSNPNIRSQNHYVIRVSWISVNLVRPWIVLEGWIPCRCFPHWLTGMPKFWFWKTVELMSSLMYLSPSRSK